MSHADQTVTMGPMLTAVVIIITSGVDAQWILCLSRVNQIDSREDVGRRCCPQDHIFLVPKQSGYNKTNMDPRAAICQWF